ncbi:hypothetical protein GIB67_035746, partial [Kingdonia uniflora]
VLACGGDLLGWIVGVWVAELIVVVAVLERAAWNGDYCRSGSDITAQIAIVLEDEKGLSLPSSNTGCVIVGKLIRFGQVSFVGVTIEFRALIVVDVVVFLVFSVIDLELRKSIRGAHFR